MTMRLAYIGLFIVQDEDHGHERAVEMKKCITFGHNLCTFDLSQNTTMEKCIKIGVENEASKGGMGGMDLG